MCQRCHYSAVPKPSTSAPASCGHDRHPIITGFCQVLTSKGNGVPSLYDRRHNACMQGQEGPAEAVLDKYTKEGGWVFLDNVHLMQVRPAHSEQQLC